MHLLHDATYLESFYRKIYGQVAAQIPYGEDPFLPSVPDAVANNLRHLSPEVAAKPAMDHEIRTARKYARLVLAGRDESFLLVPTYGAMPIPSSDGLVVDAQGIIVANVSLKLANSTPLKQLNSAITKAQRYQRAEEWYEPFLYTHSGFFVDRSEWKARLKSVAERARLVWLFGARMKEEGVAARKTRVVIELTDKLDPSLVLGADEKIRRRFEESRDAIESIVFIQNDKVIAEYR